jgi:hypothetical protein
MTIGKPGNSSSERSFRKGLAQRLGLGGDSQRKREASKVTARQRRASIERRLHTQSLEARQLLAGPELVGIQPNSGQLIRGGTSLENAPLFGTGVLQTAPNELRFQFDDNSSIDVATLLNPVSANSDAIIPRGLSITRAGSDGGFETATAITDFGTSSNTIIANRIEVEFRAAAPGVSGNGTQVRITNVNLPLTSAPVLISSVDPNAKTIDIRLNSNPTRPATVRDLLDALDRHPTARQVVTAFSVNGSTLTPIGDRLPAGGLTLNLDGANAARATTDLGLGATTQVRFLASQSGASGRDISVRVTSANLGTSPAPLVTVTNNVITVRINSNPAARTTVGQLILGINNNPTAANLINASLLRGNPSDPIANGFTTVTTTTPNGLALGGASDTVVNPGYVGIGDRPNEVVFRFAEPLPDDSYQIEIYGSGDRALRNTNDEAFNAGVDFAVQFAINSPPRVLAVVPEPVTKLSTGRLISEPNVVEVYFTNDVNDSVMNKDYYSAVFTRDTVTGSDDEAIKPVSVERLGTRTDAVRVIFNSPFSRTPDPDNIGSNIDGAVRFRVGNDTLLPSAPTVTTVTEAGDSITRNTAAPLAEPGPMLVPGFSGANQTQTTSVRLVGGSIENPTTFDLQFPGGSGYEGVRDIRPDDPTRNDRVVPLGVWRTDGDTTPGISTIYYNFPSEWQGEDFDSEPTDLNQTYRNLITEQQKVRAREVASLFSEYLGIQFIEVGEDAAAAISSPDFTGQVGPVYSIGVGELASTFDGLGVLVPSAAGGVTVSTRELDDNGNTFLDPALTFDFEIPTENGNRLIVLDGQDFDQSTDDFTGGEFFRGVFLGIGQLLGYGYADHLPQPITQSTASVLDEFIPIQTDIPATTAELFEPNEASFPSPADIVNGQFLYRPESNDIDLYEFTLANAGTISISTIAERLASSSTLDTMLRLYKIEGGIPIEIAANDDYFSNDSLIEIEVAAGKYIVGVSASGNDSYDPIISGTGIGGVTEGDYEVAMTFTPKTSAANSISDGSQSLDGDADGEAGGLFQFWFEPNDANTTVFVDNSGGTSGTGTPGSITNPFRTLNAAFQSVEARRGSASQVEVVRVVSGGTYRIGRTAFGSALTNGELTTIDVPKDVNLILDAGVRFEMQGSRIGVGSTSASNDRSASSIQVLGKPDQPVQLVGFGTNPGKGTWGGIDIRGDVDFADDSRVNMENNGVFLNHIQFADIRNGGGVVSVDGASRTVSPIELAETRATIINSRISNSADGAIAATPNTFAETRFDEARFQNELAAGAGLSRYFTSDFDRVGPHIRGNTIVDNTYNGLLLRIDTPTGGGVEKLEVNARFDDTDIVHILIENLQIEGSAGGPVSLSDAPSLLLTQATAQVNTVNNRVGDVPQGQYAYRMTYVTRDGFESVASDASLTVTLAATGAIALTNLPTVASGAEFTGRRLYRAAVTGTDVNGQPIYGEFTRIGRLNTSSTSFTDTLGAGFTELDADRIGAASLALSGRLDPGLTIDPGTIVKLNSSRIDVTFGARLFAEGTDAEPIVMTSLNDRRYGTGGTFNTNGLFQDSTAGAATSLQAGDWGGIFVAFGADASIDHAVLAGGGGATRIEGGFASFNVIEAHQSDLRVANTRFELNDNGRSIVNDGGNNTNNPDDPREQRVGRVNNASGTIFVRAGQPIIIDNTFVDGNGPVMSFDVNSFTWQEQTDYGRSTGKLDAMSLRGNSGPLVKNNRIATDGNGTGGLAGLEVRGGKVATEVVWDDTDIVHIVRDMIEVPNQHIYGGLRLESDARGSLVVKFANQDLDLDDALLQRRAGIVVGGNTYTAENQMIDIADRIGGSLQIIGMPDFPVILTALSDDAVGAGFTPAGRANVDTDNNGLILNTRTAVNVAERLPPGLPLSQEFSDIDVETDLGRDGGNQAADSPYIIDNDISEPNQIGHLETSVDYGGRIERIEATGFNSAQQQALAAANLQFLYTTFINVTQDLLPFIPNPEPVELFDAFLPTDPIVIDLANDDRVVSTGIYDIDYELAGSPAAGVVFPTIFGRQIRWRAETFILDNRGTIYTQLNFETVDGLSFDAGRVRSVDVISYNDTGSNGLGGVNNLLFQKGTPGQADFRLTTVNQTTGVAFNHGGIYTNDSFNQNNATYSGFSAGEFAGGVKYVLNEINNDTLVTAISSNLDGNHFQPLLEYILPTVEPIFEGVTPGTFAIGPAGDFDTAHQWRLNNSAVNARVTSFLEFVPSDPALEPFPFETPASVPGAGTWDGIVIREAASDSNASITSENEPSNVGLSDTNALASRSQFLGEVAPSRAAGDENRRLGLIVDGELSSSGDVDVYSFVAEGGTQVWIDIDRTSLSLDTIVELVNTNGQTLVLSDDAIAEAALIEELLTLDAADPTTAARRAELRRLIASRTGRGGEALDIDAVFGLATGQIDASAGNVAFQDQYSINPRDAGMRVTLPGVVGQRTLYHVRVRSAVSPQSKATLTTDEKNRMVVGNTSNVAVDEELLLNQTGGLRSGLTKGSYQLQVRIEERDVSPGTQIRYSDVLYADNGVQIIGGPMHSPLTGDDYETALDNSTFGTAQRLGLYDTQFTGDPAIAANQLVLPDGSILISRDGNFNLTGAQQIDRVDVLLNNGAGPLSSDRLAKNISGFISDRADVDWYEFEISYQQLTRDGAALYLATVFDIDYADGAARADLSLYVFDELGQLVLIGGDSNIADDINTATNGTSNLSGGSFGTADPYIGSAELPQGTYFVAVSNKYVAPAQLDQFTTRNPTNPLIRLEPIDSTRRIAEEGFTSLGDETGYTQVAQGPVVPVLFDTDSIIEHTLDDVFLYVNSGTGLFLVNPFTGARYANLGGFGTTINDVAFTANGELFGYTIPQNIDDGNYNYARINTVNAGLTLLENTGIETNHDLAIEGTPAAPAPQILDEESDDGLIVNGITIRARFGVETGYLVGNRPTPRQGLTPGPNFERQGYTTNILYAFDEQTGEATGPNFNLTLLNAGAGTNIREIGQIDTSADPDDGTPDDANVLGVSSASALNAAGVFVPQLFDGDTFTLTNGTNFVTFELNQGYTLVSSSPATIANGTLLRVTLPGRAPTTFELSNAATPSTPGNVLVNIDRTASDTVFIERLATAIRNQGIPVSFKGTQLALPSATVVTLTPPGIDPVVGLTLSGSNLVQPGNTPIALVPTDSAETIVNRIVQAISTENATGALPTVIGTSLGRAVRITGVVVSANSLGGNLRLGGFANGGTITGIELVDNNIYAVSNTGGLYVVPSGALFFNGNQNVGQYVQSSTDLIGINFSGLRAGPNSLRDAAGRQILFGITPTGTIHAFNLDGELQGVFAGGRTSIETGVGNAQGLDFATLDYNLWHVTGARGADPGHGIGRAFSAARPGEDGGNSLLFNYTAGAFNDRYAFGEAPAPGAINTRQDGQAVNNTYNFPGGARGQVQSNAFSLEGYSAADLPMMYFSYFLDTDGVDDDSTGDNDADLLGEVRDTLRVYVVDSRGVEHLVATNNESRSAGPTGDEFDDPDQVGIYDDDIDVDVQQLYDNTGTWRQARVPLGAFAGQAGLSLRIEFATAGTTSTLTGEIRAVAGSALTDGQTLIIGGETFSINLAPTVTFSSGISLQQLYANPAAISSFTVDGQQYVLNDGTRVVPAGAISINLLADLPAGTTLASLTAGDIARAVENVFDRQIDLNRILPSGTEIEQFYDANPIPLDVVNVDQYYADNPDKLFTVYLNGVEYVLLDGDTQRADLNLQFNADLNAPRVQVSVFQAYQILNLGDVDPTITTLDDLTADDVSEVIGALIGEADLAVDYDQLVPTAFVLDNFYADRDVSFVVQIDGVEYVLNDGLRTLGLTQVSVPLGNDVTVADIPGELQAIVEANTGVQVPSFRVIPNFDFSDRSDPINPFGAANPPGEVGRNDLTYEATPLPYNGGNLVVTGRGTLGTITPTLITNRGDVDLVSVNLVAGTTVTVDVTADQPGVENNVRFFNAQGVELVGPQGNLLAVTNINAGTISITAPSDGTYYIGISGPENGTYDPRISGTADAAQTGGYAVEITISTVLDIVADKATVEFGGAATVTVSANSGLLAGDQTALVGTPIDVSRHDTAAEVAQALQLALAKRFADGNAALIPRLGSAIRLPNLQFSADQLGPFQSTAERYGDQFGGDYQAGAASNDSEGAYIDDIIIGFAERGELVTAATPIAADEAFVDSGELSITSPAKSPRPTSSGAYQLEIRDASEYVASGNVPEEFATPLSTDAIEARFRTFDTNDRLVSSAVSLVTKPAAEILDGSTFTIAGANNRVTFEFDILDATGVSNGFAQNANRVLVQLPSNATAEQVADRIISRISSQQVRTLLGVTANRGNLTRPGTQGSVPDKRINLVGATSIRTNAIGATAFESTVSEDLRGDSNRDREEQGVIMIENSRFVYNEDAGLQISRAASEAVVSQSPRDATPSILTYARNFLERNTENYIPGVVIRNNTFAFNQSVGIDIRGLENGGFAAENPVGFDRILNNTLVGGSITPVAGLGSQVFDGTFFPEGGISFADVVLDSLTVFGPDVEQSFTDSEAALGSPDCHGVSATDPENGLFTFSLGSGGRAVFAFQDNLLTGSSSNPSMFVGVGDGIDDLVIFETGIPERVRVEISRDNVTYFNVGEIFGLDNKIDLDAFGFGLNDRFSYVRLTDLSPSGTNNFGAGGADIDAIGAISTVPREEFTPGRIGIQVQDNAAPTLLNNIVSNFQVGLAVAPTPLVSTGLFDQSASLTVIGGTTYYRNNLPTQIVGSNGIGAGAQFIDPSDQVFVDPFNLIFTPQSRTPIIDSGIASLQDRASLITLRNSLGLPVSPIIAPLYDANGQLRVDDPTFDTPFGAGLSGFVDRGAEERTDSQGPRFVLTSPRGQDLIFDQTRELFGRSITQGTIYDAFEIQLIDGIRPADTGFGVGVNDNTVTSENLLVTRLVVGSSEVELLEEGRDYRFAYEPADNTIRITPIAGIWADNAVYTVEFLGLQNGSVDGFTAVLKALSGTNYGDGDKTFVDGEILETELGIQLSVPSESLIATDPFTGISRPAIGQQTITIFDGINTPVTFEFVTDVFEEINPDGTVATTGNIAIRLPSTSTPTRIVQLLAQAINNLAATRPNVLNIEAVFLDVDNPNAADTGRLQLLGTHANSNLAYVLFEDPEGTIFRQVNRELDVQLLPDTTLDVDGTRLTNYNETINVFDGTREISFEFDTDGVLDIIGPDVNRIVLPVAADASPRVLVQTLLDGFADAGLDLQASGASGVFRVRGTNGPIAITAPGGGALITGNSQIGVDLGFGLEIPMVEGEISTAVQDGQTFTISRGLSTPVTFEIDFDGNLINAGATPVTVFGGGFGGSVDLLANEIVRAVGVAFPTLAPVNRGGGRITLGSGTESDLDIRLNTAGTVIDQVGSPGDTASLPVVIRYNDDENTVAAAFASAANAAGLGGADGSGVRLIDNRVLLKTTGTPRGDAVVTDFIADKAGNRLQPASERVSSRVEILVGELSDYGDASLTFGNGQNYATTIQTNGPSHTIVDNATDALYLGSSVTADINGANDDLDIDDGVIQLGSLQPGFTTDFEVSFNQGVGVPRPSRTSYLDVWFDWNGNGVFEAGTSEVSRFNFPANNPFLVNTLGIAVPSTARLGDVQARFRLSYEAGLGATGATNAGEVEDYVFTVVNNPFTGRTDTEDVNDSGAVTPLDALLIINVLNANGGPVDLTNVPAGLVLPAFPDVNGDGMITEVDALRVINRLNRENSPGNIPGTGEPIDMSSSQTVGYSPVATGVLASNATIVLDPTRLNTSVASGEPLAETPGVGHTLTESAKTSIFDSPLAMRLDSIVDSMVAGGQDGQSSQSEEGLTALDDFFAELG